MFHDWGSSGLTLFIVLSGFLITYLLFFEQSTQANSILRIYKKAPVSVGGLVSLIFSSI